MRLLVKGGRVIDPEAGLDEVLDILIENGKIVSVASGIPAKGIPARVGAGAGAGTGTGAGGGAGIETVDEVVDASGMIVTPGLVDMHVHLREPGREDEETIETGTAAAAAGGFTSIACMPNTTPPLDTGAFVEAVRMRAARAGLVNVFPVGAITKGLAGEELAEIGELRDAGVVGLSDDGRSVMNAEVMRRAMEYAQMFDLPVIPHCEDTNLTAGGVMNEGYMSTVLGLKGMSPAAEEAMVARDIILAELTGARLHITHVSTAGSVRLIRDAKRRGVRVTADATPHHFTLTDEAVRTYDTNTKMNPPLRTREDVEAIRMGLADGTIDAIASDHAPHTFEEKDVEYDNAPFGIIGLETSLPLALTELVGGGYLPLGELIRRMSSNPARILGLGDKKAGIVAGADADLTVIDVKREFTVDINEFRSLSRNSPFGGRRLKGQAFATIVGGRVVFKRWVAV
ncbi:MAG: dihydroorotase [Firmicutes bacterium]|nr:dihydroorotase [Bacillota bacterium]